MTDRVERNGLQVDAELAAFVEDEALPGSGIEAETVWAGLAALVGAFGARTKELLDIRTDLQEKIDAWHIERKGQPHDVAAYKAFLEEIGYLVDNTPGQIETARVDSEIQSVAGPQLVVPVTNPRFLINAANARWGSLYDALYGTDALGTPKPPGGFDTARGAEVVAWAKAHLDKVVPLVKGSWADVQALAPSGGKLMVVGKMGSTSLKDPAQFAGFNRGADGNISDLFLRVNGLHIVLFLDRKHAIGKDDPAGIADIILEAAISSIVDFEDSVAAVDGPDKTRAYRNWLGLMRGDLTAEVPGTGPGMTLRELNDDIGFLGPDQQPRLAKGRSLLLVRNVGHLMPTPAVLDAEGNEIPEGLLDSLITVLCSVHDLLKTETPMNSPAKSVYVVKPKQHGPDEVALTDQVFSAVEKLLGLRPYTVKVGLMDEERRTSANLAACIGAAQHRIAFVNTGFLDRTGDEIHTSMEAGPMMGRVEMAKASWLAAYEKRNVDIAIACGLKGRAQIGKGMWTRADDMKGLLEHKVGHPMAGATTAWVANPMAAVLHATHYHEIDVFQKLFEIAEETQGGMRAPLEDLLTIPVMTASPDAAEITSEVENAAQGILGYVVRWVDQGIGCSKVPDINDVALMEDRATCRISSQMLVNWIHHGVVTEGQVMEAFRKMAALVDRQNAEDPLYRPMAPDFEGHAFQAACDLVFKGGDWPSGYTEPALHARRLQVKATLTPTATVG